jgi:hypothetical protein
MIVEITIYGFVVNFAFRLFGTDALYSGLM